MSFSPFRIKVLALALLVNAQTSALAQEPRDTELRESVVSIDITLADLYSRSETRPLIVTVFRPPGDGVHPVLIFNHGRPAIGSKFKEMGRQRFHSVARFFTAQGFVVMVPTRVGYGQTHSSFDPEYAGPCLTQQLKSREEAVSRQVMATLEFARTQDYVDGKPLIVAGLSVGGFTAITVANRAPEGLVGARESLSNLKTLKATGTPGFSATSMLGFRKSWIFKNITDTNYPQRACADAATIWFCATLGYR